MIVHSYTICHYGRDYLATALRSIAPIVDRQFVFFTPHPRTDTELTLIPLKPATN